jgi:hypothetical protein
MRSTVKATESGTERKVGLMHGLPAGLDWGEKIFIVRLVPSGGSLNRETLELKVALLSSMQVRRRFTLLIKTCAGEIDSVLIFGQRHTTYGHSGMTGPSVFSMRGRFLPQSLLIRFTTTPSRTLLSLIPWLVEEVHSTFAIRWDDVV